MKSSTKTDQNEPFEKVGELYIIDVVPIQKGITRDTLSYFTKESVGVGAFVKIPVRNKEIFGLVTGVHEASEMKSDLKSASFALKKLSKSKVSTQLSPAFIQAAQQAADYYSATIGSMLGALIPKLLLDQPQLISSGHAQARDASEPSREPFVIQLPDTDRMREYKSLIRESFARKRSVLFCVPTHEDALRAFDYLSQGIEMYSFMTSNKTPKALIETLKDAHKEPHPVLFITTPSFISFDRPDLHTIIFERENARAYRTLNRPYIHYKVFLEYLAKASGKMLVMGDSVLSFETLYKEKQGLYADLSPLKWRITRDIKSTLVDMKLQKKESEEVKKTFEVLSPELIALIAEAISEKRKIFLFGARKGLAPSTSCKDCGQLLGCENCGSPMVLHKKGAENIYICHSCGARRSSETRCDNCQSWNLVPLGIGTDTIAATVKNLFPTADIHILDKDHASTPVQARTIAKKFASQKGGILIGTELAFAYLLKVPYVGLVSIDSLFSIPDFSINERIFYLITRLLDIAESRAIVQTRNIRKQVLAHAERGNILDFYRTEIEERRELSYPPFSIFIKVQFTGSQSEIEQRAAYLKRLFGEEEPDFMIGKGMQTGKLVLSMIMRLPRERWPDKTIREKLLLLPPEFSIKVDPDSIT